MDDLAGSAEADVVVHVFLAEAAAVHGLGAFDNAEHRLRERRRDVDGEHEGREV
jgi:hypothetical protein